MITSVMYWILVVDAVSLVTLVSFYLVLAGVKGVRKRRNAVRMLGMHELMQELVDGQLGSRKDVQRLRLSPITLKFQAFTRYQKLLSGAALDRLNDLALASGLTDHAVALCRSRWWWRRLFGLRMILVVGGNSSVAEALLKDRSARVRAQAALWAGENGSRHRTQLLLVMLSDASLACRFAAKFALANLKDQAVSQLAEFLTTQHVGLVEALEVAAVSPHASYVKPAINLAQNSSPLLRSQTATLLGNLGGLEAAECLVQLLSDPVIEVRAAAAHSLGKLAYWQAAPQLFVALKDQSWDVRQEAARGLVAMGGAGELYLRKALTDSDRYASDMARQVMGLSAPGGAS